MQKNNFYFVCAAIIKNNLILNTIIASTEKEANELFFNKNKIRPSKIEGPFLKKIQIENSNIKNEKIKLSNKMIKATYKNWLVNAFFLTEPKDHALLVFVKSLNNSNKPNKKIVSIKELNIINE